MSDRIREFHRDRLDYILHNTRAPVPLQGVDRICLHVIPFSAIEGGTSIDLKRAKAEYYRFAPIGGDRADTPQINLDGLLAISHQTDAGVAAYVQAFRSGAIEAVACNVVAEEVPERKAPRRIYAERYSEALIDAFAVYARVLDDYGIPAPAAIIVSLLGVAGVSFCWASGGYGVDYGPILDRAPLVFTDVVISEWPTNRLACAEALRPILNELANAGGRVRSTIFDDDGDYTGPKDRRG